MKRNKDNPFDILRNRAMISLGPISSNKHCPYSCLFCYVPNGFLQYSSLEIPDICKYLEAHKDEFETIYISGDTDSFAPPRSDKGMSLLKRLAKEFHKDILITTRVNMDDSMVNDLLNIKNILASRNKYLYVCISISTPDDNLIIEPLPIPTVDCRIETLKRLKNAGIISILAMRPLLPIYQTDDYIRLIDTCSSSVDLILGEVWYHDPCLKMWEAVTGEAKIHRGTSKRTQLPFDGSNREWEEWSDHQMVKEITNYCESRNIPFYMESSCALNYLRSRTCVSK